MAQSALIAAFLAGLVGGLHCFAMCGGYVVAVGQANHPAPLLPLRSLLTRQMVSHGGRLAMYALLGAASGSVGALAYAAAWTSVQQALYVVANLLLLMLAMSIATRHKPFAALERAGLALHAGVARLLRTIAGAQSGRTPGRFALGLLWGLTPCALVYAVLPVAMLAGSAAEGALVMFVFGLGTLPNLLAASAIAARCRHALARPVVRSIVAFTIAAFGVAGMYRGLFAADALAHGPFCVVP